jgi:hypothetical protein
MRKKPRNVPTKASTGSADSLVFDSTLLEIAPDGPRVYLDFTVDPDGFIATFRIRGEGEDNEEWQQANKSAFPAKNASAEYHGEPAPPRSLK